MKLNERDSREKHTWGCQSPLGMDGVGFEISMHFCLHFICLLIVQVKSERNESFSSKMRISHLHERERERERERRGEMIEEQHTCVRIEIVVVAADVLLVNLVVALCRVFAHTVGHCRGRRSRGEID